MYTIYQYLDLSRTPKPRFISYAETYIYTIYYNLDMQYKSRFFLFDINLGLRNTDITGSQKIVIMNEIVHQFYIVYQNLYAYRIPKPRFIPYTKS
jgi:hypothetical protein